MLVPMVKVRIIAMRRDLEAVLALIHRLGTLDPAVTAAPQGLSIGTVRRARVDEERMRSIDASIERAQAVLGAVASTAAFRDAADSEVASLDETVSRMGDVLRLVEPIVQPLLGRRAALDAELAALRRHEHAIRQILPLPEELLDLAGSETIALVLQPGYEAALDLLQAELVRRTDGLCEIVSAPTDGGGVAILLVFTRRHAATVHELLRGEHLSEVRLPDEYRGRPLRETLGHVRGRIDAIPGEIAQVDADLRAILAAHGPTLAHLRRSLIDAKAELALVARCLETDHAFVLTGWMPAREQAALERALVSAFAGRVVVERLPIGRAEVDEMPVLLENPMAVRPFEVLLRLFPAPRYGTIDPTPFLAFFFPFFFGLILGDIGYGLIVAALGAWLQVRSGAPAWARQAGQVLTAAGSAAVVFGVAFGELFGDLGHAFGLRPLVADRSEAIPSLLLFCVALGAAQVGLGLVLGVVNGFLRRQRREAISRAGILLGLIAVFVLIGVVADVLPGRGMGPGVILLALSLAALLYASGPFGPLEIVGAVGNVLSYVRLAAVGLASAFLADVANELGGRTGSLVLGIVVGGLLHALNLALGLVGPTLQGLRLQYVEFFGRFFEPGGRPYRPFRRPNADTSTGRA